uniref:Transmembrane protein n=1 Tax=Noccaea caerulescens TaxID=107243 RepID=A0A1J3K5B0_NOCCA
MAAKLVSSSASSLVPSFFSPFQPRSSFQLRPSTQQPAHLHCYHSLQLKTDKIDSLHISFRDHKQRKVYRKRAYLPLATTSEQQSQYTEDTSNDPETVSPQIGPEGTPQDGSSTIKSSGGNDGKSGFVSFYNPQNKTEDIVVVPPEAQSTMGRLLWLIGPAVLVSSFILPPLYLRRIVSAVFEDSLLTDFLILFFTEALFYCGVAAFLLVIDRSRKSSGKGPNSHTSPSQLGQRISSVATLVLSLMIPMVTMGFVWPWTGPAASATLAPYLVGIVVQFAFEQYARYRNSPSSPVIPIIFQVYRLHQLNRAAQLVTALSFTVKGAEATVNNLAIKKSLGTLLSVIQVLGVISIWSISSFLMWLSPSPFQN